MQALSSPPARPRDESHCKTHREFCRFFVASCLVALCAVVALSTAKADEKTEFFKTQVEPILQKRCFSCHSHSSGTMESNLALDWKSGWEKGGDRGPAIAPRDAEKSLLIRAIRHTEAELQMPEEKLPQEEIDAITKWVVEGAVDPREAKPASAPSDWWSLKPIPSREDLLKAALPNAENAIDGFVLAKLAQSGLKPSPQASPQVLVRRLYYDMHGLPPNEAECAEFLNSPTDENWSRLVDRVLASPRYGERWARHWLDAIHFADSHGTEHDVFRPFAWRYRDYVIESFNQDTPWPRLIREQVASDHFFPDEPALAAALGYLGAGPYDLSAAATAPKSFEYMERDDIVTQTMASFVSTTANCARCHSHKFDPITQEDYFSLQAVFAGVAKGNVLFDEDKQVAARRAHWENLQKAAAARDAALLLTEESAGFVAAYEANRGQGTNWQILPLTTFVSTEGAEPMRLPDESILIGGARVGADTTVVTASPGAREITAFRLEVVPDDSLPQRGPGRAENGNLHLHEFEAQVLKTGAKLATKLKFAKASADFDQSGWTSAMAIDGNLKTGWAIHPAVGQQHELVVELDKPLSLDAGDQITILLKQPQGGIHTIGRFRLSTSSASSAAVMHLPSDARDALAVTPKDRNEAQRVAIASIVVAAKAAEELARLPAKSKVFGSGNYVENQDGLVSLGAPKPIFVLKRGDIAQPGDQVGPGTLTAIDCLQARFEFDAAKPEAARRAALSEWIADPKNPLTWRSIVNRVWQHHFGKGIVDTPSDFGRMGSTPSHPELLDYLAAWFRDDTEGSLKRLHRLILTSKTWRQSSAGGQEAVDPENKYLWRGNRRRLDADAVRDFVTTASGRLDLTMYGPGVQHFTQRPGPQTTPTLDYKAFDWNTPAGGRRSIYRVVWRGMSDPFMEVLDFPDMGLLQPTRGFSASALQALALMNNDFMLAQSSFFAERCQREAGSELEERVRFAVRTVWSREATGDELAALKGVAEKHGLAAVCRALLNSNEFLFVE
jgi:hypothetical protein